jgi:DNA-binding CsgD family transcriptional regulator/pimeloyl-ACP methyl ester carboxylesterase
VDPQAVQYAVTRDEIRIAFTVSGSGQPLIHMPNDGVSSLLLDRALPERRRWALALARQFTVVRYDGRGHGLSQRDVADFSQETAALDLDAVAARAGFSRFVLFGFLGTVPAAVRYAAEHPDRVSHLVLWPPDTREPSAEEYKGLGKLAVTDWETFTETYAHLALGWDEGDSAHRYAEIMRESISHESYLRMAARARATPPLQVVAEWGPRVTAPALILQRKVRYAADRLRQIATALPDARLVILEGTRTLPYQGDVRAVVDAIAAFVGSTGEPPASPVAASLSAASRERMTPREMEILVLIANGRSNQQIAEELVLSVRTVERHLANIYEKIGASGKSARAAAAVLALRPRD